MPMLKGIISKINGSAGNLSFKQTGGQTIVSESHAPSAWGVAVCGKFRRTHVNLFGRF